MTRTAHHEGAAARMRGEAARAPYAPASKEYRAFMAGWRLADFEFTAPRVRA